MDKNVIKKLGVFLIVKFKDTHFTIHESTNLQSKQFGVNEVCTELCGTLEV